MSFIGAVIQLVFLILNNYFEKDKEEKERKKEIAVEFSDAVKSRDLSRITRMLDRMHGK